MTVCLIIIRYDRWATVVIKRDERLSGKKKKGVSLLKLLFRCKVDFCSGGTSCSCLAFPN